MADTVFYDLGKLEAALAQRDALVKALEEIAHKGVTTGYGKVALARIARDAIRAAVSTPTSRHDDDIQSGSRRRHYICLHCGHSRRALRHSVDVA